jgi:hypothetical protein
VKHRAAAAALVAASTWAALCAGPAAQAADVQRKGRGIEVRGTILNADAARIVALLDSDTHSLRVRSSGGELEAAITIGLALHRRGLPVVVDGICASACAQFILPAAAWVHVLDDSVIALHAASHGALQAAAREGAMDSAALAPARRRYEALQAQVEHYRAVVQPPAAAWDFLYRLTSAAELRVWSATQDGHRGSQAGLVGQAGQPPVCEAWLLDSTGLQAFGVKTLPLPWRAPDRAQAAARLRVPAEQIYVGPALGADQPASGATCADLGQKARSGEPN